MKNMKYFGLTESESSSGLFCAIIDTFTICYWSYEVCVPWVRGGGVTSTISDLARGLLKRMLSSLL